MAQNDRQTDKHTHGHGDSMTDPAQRAESVKSKEMFEVILPQMKKLHYPERSYIYRILYAAAPAGLGRFGGSHKSSQLFIIPQLCVINRELKIYAFFVAICHILDLRTF